MGVKKEVNSILKRLDMIEEDDPMKVYAPQRSSVVNKEELVELPHKEIEDEEESDETPSLWRFVGIIALIGLLIAMAVYGYRIYSSHVGRQLIGRSIDRIVNTGVFMSKDIIPVDEILKNDLVVSSIDSDGDNISNVKEVELGTKPFMWDSDMDGIPDDIEITKGLNPNSPDVNSKLADIRSLGINPKDLISIRELDKERLSKLLGIPQYNIVQAVKVYNSLGEIELQGFGGTKTLITYVPEFNGYKKLSFKMEGDTLITNLEGNGVVIGFSLDENRVSKMIKYKEIKDENSTLQFFDKASGVLDVDSTWGIDNFKTIKFGKLDEIKIVGLVDDKGYSSGIGQAWLLGAVVNRAKLVNEADLASRYKGYIWVKSNSYQFNLWDITPDRFGDLPEAIRMSRKVNVDKLEPPTSDFIKASLYMTSIVLDKSAEDIALKRVYMNEAVLKKILDELMNGRAVLALMSNDKYVHGVVIYGVNNSNLDNDIYNFLVYDANLGMSQVLQVEINKDRGLGFISCRYGFIEGSLDFNSKDGDVFLFYKIRSDLYLERIN